MQLKNIDSLRNFNTRYVFLFTDMILATKTELTDKSLFERKFGAATIQGLLEFDRRSLLSCLSPNQIQERHTH